LVEDEAVHGMAMEHLVDEPFLEVLEEVSQIHLTQAFSLVVLELLVKVLLEETDLLMLAVFRWVLVAVVELVALDKAVLVLLAEELVDSEEL
jgi:hypothetical protein